MFSISTGMVVLTSTIVTIIIIIIIIIIIRCVVLPVAAAGIFICSDTRLSLPLQESGLEVMGSSRIGHQPVLAVLTLCRRRSVSQDLAVQDGRGCMICAKYGVLQKGQQEACEPQQSLNSAEAPQSCLPKPLQLDIFCSCEEVLRA